MTDPATTFAALFEQLRLAKRWTPAELSRRLDVSPSQVSRWRRGEGVPSIEAIQTISTLFGVDRETLEQLAGYRANISDSAQATISPEVAALADAERTELLDELRDIPPIFWAAIFLAQRSARRAAVDTAKAALEFVQQATISTPADGEIASPPRQPGQDRRASDRPENGPLASTYALAGAI